MMPNGTPTASDSSTAADISASVWMLSSQSPMSANETNAAATMSAARQPPKRSTISTEAAIVPTHVSHSSRSLSAVTSQSASARKPSKTAKMTFGFSAVRCSSSQVCSVVEPLGQLHPGQRDRPGELVAQQQRSRAA